MADTLNSWKQLFQAKQGFEQLNEVVVGPKGGVSISLREAVIVTEGMACTVTAKDRDKVVINAEVCCPPIEFTNIMGEQDINRPGTPREDYGRVIWNTNSPTTSRLTWGPFGFPTANLVEGSSVEAKQHELFFTPLVVGDRYQFIVGGCRAFCGDCASSLVYAFGANVLGEIQINLSNLGIQVLTELLIPVSTTINLDVHNWWVTDSDGAEGPPTRLLGLGVSTTPLLTVATTAILDTPVSMFTSTAITTVP